MSSSAPTVEEATEASAPVTVRLRGIGKRFPGVIANDDINIDVRRGTIHAIVGENGAGKSTLMKILYGVQPPDSGTIEINGEQVTLHSPADAIKAGVGMVFQHFMLADNLTVLENVVLGAEKLHGIGGDARAEVKRISDAYGLGIEPDRLVEELGVGARQRVEILKVLYRGASIVILDEPTAVLVPQEVDELFGNLRGLKKEGLSVIFISHKLDEVLSVADEITVIRRGTTVRTVLPDGGHRPSARRAHGRLRAALAQHRDLDRDRHGPAVGQAPRLPGADGRPLLDDITFDIHKGEVLGIAGVEGNGQAELVESIMGMRPARRGTDRARRQGPVRPVHARAPRVRRRLHPRGPAPSRPAARRAAVGEPRPRPPEPPAQREGPLIDKGGRPRGHRADHQGVRRPHARPGRAGPGALRRQPAEADRRPRDEQRPDPADRGAPDPGVDVGAQAAIWAHIKTARRNGLAVLLISADLDELIGLSDRIEVILRGRLVGTFDPDDVTPEQLGSAMTGAGRMTPAHDQARPGAQRAGAGARGRVRDHQPGAGRRRRPGARRVGPDPLRARDPQRGNIIDNATVLYLSGLAAAIGFRMNLFNIGVDGQYRIAAFTAAVVAGEAWLPGYLNTVLAVLCAMAVGALWAGIAGVLRATRGVSEVISTIMLNAIATFLVAYLLRKAAVREEGSNAIATKKIPEGSRIPDITIGDGPPVVDVYGFLIIAIAHRASSSGSSSTRPGSASTSGPPGAHHGCGRQWRQRHQDDRSPR